MTIKFNASYTLERGEDEFDISILAEYTPGESARGMFGPPENSSPGYGAEVSVLEVRRGKDKIDLTDAEEEKIEQYLLENYDDEYSDDGPEFEFNIEDESD